MISRRELYAAGEPFGDSATYMEAGRMVCGGGGGGSAPQTSVTTQEIPAELKPLAKAYTDKAINLSNQSYQPYTGQRYADLNATQNAGIGMTQNRALNGDSTINSGANFLQNQLNSGSAMATMNPYGGVSAGMNYGYVSPGSNNSQINPGMNYNQMTAGVNNSQVSAGSNPYAEQNNPYLDQMVAQAQNQVKQNFMNSAINSGSFGNSGLQQQYGLGLANIATNMYGNAYNTQAQLKADDLNRSLNAQQFNSGVIDNNIARNMQAQQFNSGITDANLARNMQAQQFNSGIVDSNLARNMQAQQFNSGITDSNLARNLNAQQFNSNLGNDWASRNDSMYNNSMSQKLNAANLGLNYGNQAYTDASKLMQAGQVQQDQAQNNLDYRYGQYQDQQNLPYKQLASMAGVFGSNLGGTSTTTNTGGGGK